MVTALIWRDITSARVTKASRWLPTAKPAKVSYIHQTSVWIGLYKRFILLFFVSVFFLKAAYCSAFYMMWVWLAALCHPIFVPSMSNNRIKKAKQRSRKTAEQTSCVCFTDIDECQDDSVCTQGHCQNTEGSFFCNCEPGFVLSSTEDQCDGTTVHVCLWFIQLLLPCKMNCIVLKYCNFCRCERVFGATTDVWWRGPVCEYSGLIPVQLPTGI